MDDALALGVGVGAGGPLTAGGTKGFRSTRSGKVPSALSSPQVTERGMQSRAKPRTVPQTIRKCGFIVISLVKNKPFKILHIEGSALEELPDLAAGDALADDLPGVLPGGGGRDDHMGFDENH